MIAVAADQVGPAVAVGLGVDEEDRLSDLAFNARSPVSASFAPLNTTWVGVRVRMTSIASAMLSAAPS